MSKQDKEYLTPNEVAKLLKVSPVTVRYWAQKGLLAAEMTPGGHRRFNRNEVARFARERGINLFEDENEQMRILIVDDNHQVASFLAELFSMFPDRVVTEIANNGFDAGQKVRVFKPNLVLMDVMMPDMNGFEACEMIKRDPETAGIRVIAMSGYCTPENLERITHAGAETCIRKPIDTHALLKLIGLR
jgi:excisionase family DNA binding protein